MSLDFDKMEEIEDNKTQRYSANVRNFSFVDSAKPENRQRGIRSMLELDEQEAQKFSREMENKKRKLSFELKQQPVHTVVNMKEFKFDNEVVLFPCFNFRIRLIKFCF